MFQPFSLALHSELVLTDEDAAEHIENLLGEWKPGKDIPCSREFYARAVGVDRNDDGAVGEPVVADANLLDANVGQRELDGCVNRISVEAQQFVSATVCRRSVCANAKAHRDWLEGLLFLMDA